MTYTAKIRWSRGQQVIDLPPELWVQDHELPIRWEGGRAVLGPARFFDDPIEGKPAKT